MHKMKEILNVKAGGTYSYHWALKCKDKQESLRSELVSSRLER
jgi:hypothetical protein